MRIREILTEAREAPLYHFTLESKFFKILSTNVLFAPGGKIYFTRDYGRQFSPANILKGTWGFRINQDKLRQKYGRKLQAGGHAAMSEKERKAWLADPANAEIIEKVKKGEFRGTLRINGTNVQDIVRGTAGSAARWESEEWLLSEKLENLDQYITGIVYAGGEQTGLGRGQDFTRRSAKPESALEELAKQLMAHFQGDAGWKRRDWLIDYMTERNIPFVYQRQDFPAKQVKSTMIAMWRERKAEKERRSKEDGVMWIVRDPLTGRGVTVTAPAGNPALAAKRALSDNPAKYPNGIGSVEQGGTTWKFEEPYTNPKLEPKVKQSE